MQLHSATYLGSILCKLVIELISGWITIAWYTILICQKTKLYKWHSKMVIEGEKIIVMVSCVSYTF